MSFLLTFGVRYFLASGCRHADGSQMTVMLRGDVFSGRSDTWLRSPRSHDASARLSSEEEEARPGQKTHQGPWIPSGCLWEGNFCVERPTLKIAGEQEVAAAVRKSIAGKHSSQGSICIIQPREKRRGRFSGFQTAALYTEASWCTHC